MDRLICLVVQHFMDDAQICLRSQQSHANAMSSVNQEGASKESAEQGCVIPQNYLIIVPQQAVANRAYNVKGVFVLRTSLHQSYLIAVKVLKNSFRALISRTEESKKELTSSLL